MDIHFVDPSEAPVPPEEVRIREIQIQPAQGGKILAVEIQLTPFQERPSLEVEVFDQDDTLVANTSIIEAVSPRMEFNLHLRASNGDGRHRMRVEVGYPEDEPVDVKDVNFDMSQVM